MATYIRLALVGGIIAGCNATSSGRHPPDGTQPVSGADAAAEVLGQVDVPQPPVDVPKVSEVTDVAFPHEVDSPVDVEPSDLEPPPEVIPTDDEGALAPDVPEPEADSVDVASLPCAFDKAKQGKIVGKAVKNFGLKDWTGTPHFLHDDCGKKKLIWLILSTGWDGSVESYAPDVEALYEKYAAQGLQILWVLGETKDHEPPTIAQAQAFVADTGATFLVLRDYEFLQCYGAVEPLATMLPQEYLLDGATMVLLATSGGLGSTLNAKVAELMGAP